MDDDYGSLVTAPLKLKTSKKKKKQVAVIPQEKLQALEALLPESNTVSIAPLIQKTEAELKFEAASRKKLLENAASTAEKSHKQRVHEFNAKLEHLSEHYDIPKVGPG